MVGVLFAACGDGGPVAAVQNFVNLGQKAESVERPPADLGALDGLRDRRLDVADPDRAKVDAVLEVPIATPPARALARAEAAVRAIAAEGHAVAIRVVVVPERLPVEVGAIAVAVTARDGRGWTGDEVGWRSSQVLVRASIPPTEEDVLLAAAVAQCAGEEATRLQAVVTATGTPADRVQAAWDRVRQYLGPAPH
jgi:hypothetical protein